MNLLLFSGSQSPLPVRYPHPSRPTLVLPPLVHRALHTALDAQPPSVLSESSNNALIIPHPGALSKHTLSQGTGSEYEITVKVQLSGSRSAESIVTCIRKALHVLGDVKGLTSIDIVLLGLPEGTSDNDWAEVWSDTSKASLGVKSWGTLNLQRNTLARLCEIQPPFVNELDVRDCETLPKEYTAFAASHGIQLWAGGSGAGSDPLPSAELHNLLHEFRGKLSALGCPSSSLSTRIELSEDSQSYEDCAKSGVQVDWVLSYTVLSRSRNIVKDKGYIIAAHLPSS